MKNIVLLRKMTALLTALALLLSIGAAGAGALPSDSPAPLFGTPWINSNAIGNLPPEIPEAKDDFYLNTNYLSIADAPETGFERMTDPTSNLKDVVMKVIESGEASGEDMAQLRILFDLGSDTERLTREGISPVQPYLNRIAAVRSLQELNELLLSDDFPFSPYITAPVTAGGPDRENIVLLLPALSMSDESFTGVEYYGAPIDVWSLVNMLNLSNAVYPTIAAGHLGYAGEEALEKAVELINTEISYVRHTGTTAYFLSAEYGTFGESYRFMTPAETYALCPEFPLEATLRKFGKEKTRAFATICPEWLKALNDLWKEENLALLRELTAFKVLMECCPFLDQEQANVVRLNAGFEASTEKNNGYAVCCRSVTLPGLVSQLYVEYGLGSETVDRLTKMAGDLVHTYCEMVSETEWLSEAGKEKILGKLKNMRLNVLAPADGYMDFSGLKLIPASEGGSLLDAYLAIKAYRNEKENEMIGRKATADLIWRAVSPTMVNCFNDIITNSINIFPGFLTSSVYRKDMSDMELLGSLGSIIAHEISHGFDFFGSQFNDQGIGESILNDADLEAFLARVRKIVDYFDSIEVLPGVYCSGNNLKMENTADLMGLLAAAKLAGSDPSNDLDAFFRSFARLYSAAFPYNIMIVLNTMDTHAARYLRVNVPLQMCPEFVKTYGIQEGDGMYVSPENRLGLLGG